MLNLCIKKLILFKTSDSSAEGLKRSGEILSMQARKRFAGGIASPVASTSFTEESDSNKPIDRMHADAIMNYLTRIACQVCRLKKYTSCVNVWRI